MNKDKMIEFAKEQCEIFPEDSYMGEYLRKTLKMLQAEPCEDAVSRERVVKYIKEKCNPYGKPSIDFEAGKKAIEYFKALPPVKSPRKKGEWIVEDSGNYNGKYSTCYCSNCKDYYTRAWREMKYCPNCGAEMESKCL